MEDGDFELAQAIIDGAGVALPRGTVACVVSAGGEKPYK